MHWLKDSDSAAPRIGSLLQLPSPEIVELYGLAGFDFVILDCEHGPLSIDSLRNMIRAADARQLDTLVRVSKIDESEIRLALDLGATGILVPQVENIEHVRAALSAAKYTPRGTRGYCSGVRAVGYDAKPGFVEVANNATVVIVIIENLSAAGQLDKILALPDLDAVMIGPGDLSAAMGSPGDWDGPPVRPFLEKLVKQAVGKRIPVGMHVKTPADAQSWHAMGVSFFNYGMDAQLFLRSLQSVRVKFDSLLTREVK